MTSSIHCTNTNCTDFTYEIKVSNSSKNNPLLCISKNEVNKNKKVLFFLTQTPEQLEIPPPAEKTHARETLKLKDKA